MTFDTEQLKKQLEQIESLVKANVISAERGDEWKKRIVQKFEDEQGLKPAPTTDLEHLPGRIVGGFIEALGAIARGSGATYEGLSKREGYIKENGKNQKTTRGKSPEEMMDDLPDIYKSK